MAKETTEKFSFKGWNFLAFLKGRKKLIVTAVGGLVGCIATQNPAYAAMAAGGAELLYAVFDYYIKE